MLLLCHAFLVQVRSAAKRWKGQVTRTRRTRIGTITTTPNRHHIVLIKPQVHKAFEYLEKSGEADTPDVRYTVRVRRPDGAASGRGIYLREPLDTVRKVTFTADVRPTFHEVRT